jgi:hypothetical protein
MKWAENLEELHKLLDNFPMENIRGVRPFPPHVFPGLEEGTKKRIWVRKTEQGYIPSSMHDHEQAYLVFSKTEDSLPITSIKVQESSPCLDPFQEHSE